MRKKVWAKLHYLDVGFSEDTVVYELVPKEVGRLSGATTQDIAEFLREKEIRTIVIDSAQPHIIYALRMRDKLGKILKTLRLPPKIRSLPNDRIL